MAIPQEPNQRWSLDFVSDALSDGRTEPSPFQRYGGTADRVTSPKILSRPRAFTDCIGRSCGIFGGAVDGPGI